MPNEPKNTVTEVVYDSGGEDTKRSGNLVEYIAWLNEKLQGIPEQFRASATVVIEAEEGYDYPGLSYAIKYERPETPGETAAREEKEQQQKEEAEAREKQLLAQLLAKHHPNGFRNDTPPTGPR